MQEVEEEERGAHGETGKGRGKDEGVVKRPSRGEDAEDDRTWVCDRTGGWLEDVHTVSSLAGVKDGLPLKVREGGRRQSLVAVHYARRRPLLDDPAPARLASAASSSVRPSRLSRSHRDIPASSSSPLASTCPFRPFVERENFPISDLSLVFMKSHIARAGLTLLPRLYLHHPSPPSHPSSLVHPYICP